MGIFCVKKDSDYLLYEGECFTVNYYSTIAPFYHSRAKERAKYATLLHCRTGQKYGLKVEPQNGRTEL